jgi:formylmethanofuran dehydrogenase subunit E
VSTKEIIDRAADFHGHLGPFLVVGVRMGLAGVEALGGDARYEHLSITASLPLCVPFSCIADGIQVSTRCTVGNRKLTLRDCEEIQAEFRGKESEAVVDLNRSFLENLEMQLQPGATSDMRIRQLASEVAGKPENELFTVKCRTRASLAKDAQPPRERLELDDLRTAKQRLREKKLSLVFVRNSRVIFETDRDGLRGFLQAIDTVGESLSGAAVADKIVGRAAAFLCVHSRVKAVFAVTMSQAGRETLEAHGIPCEYDCLVSMILNRKKTGRCPFEELVQDAADSEDALKRIQRQCNQTD